MMPRFPHCLSAISLLLGFLMLAPSWAQAQDASEPERTEAPIIDPDIFNSQLQLDPVEIEAAPYQRIENVLMSHVGVNKTSSSTDEISFRRTGVEGTDFIVDGISQSNPYSNVPSYSINLDAIESIQIQTSGFTAEYGNVRSGVINVTTKGDTGPPTLIKITDEELAPVAGAFVAIVNLREAHDRGMISTEEFESQTVEAIISQDISLERYGEVIQTAQNNSKLQERLLNLARQIADQAN